MEKVLIAGATGYLGSFVARELKKRQYFTRIIARDTKKLSAKNILADEVVEAEVTQSDSLKNCCQNMDIVFSSIGITKQKDGLTYMDVDYQANLNLLEEARRSGVRKFIYVSVLHGEELTQLKICAAKEKFVRALVNSGMDYCIIRPTGYFSDMGEFYEMAEKGRGFLLGNGMHKMNPIHGEDLAEVCADAIQSSNKEIQIGGPEVFTHRRIVSVAFQVSGRKEKITTIPYWLSRTLLWLLRIFSGSKVYGPIEFFMTVLSMDMVATQYGSHHLSNYFEELKIDRHKIK